MMKYIYMLLILLMAGCSDDASDDVSYEGEGGVALGFDVVVSKAGSDLDDAAVEELMESSVMKIYSSSGSLIRRYEPATECPSYLALVSGDYSVTISIGSGDIYTSDEDNMSFFGEQEFTVEPTKTSSVELECNILNTKISATFDDSLDDNLEEGYTLTVAAADAITDEMLDDTYTDKFSFDSADSGYVIADGGAIAWRFEGVLINGEVLSTGGVVAANAAAGEEYSLSLKYDKYLQLTGNIVVDESTEDKDDHFSFSPQPLIEGNGFDDDVVQLPVDSYNFDVSAIYEIAKVEVKVGDDVFTPSTDGATGSDSGVSYVKISEKEGAITLNGTIYDNSGAGENIATIEVTDITGGVGKQTLSVLKSGIIEVKEVDLWTNSAVVSICSIGDNPSLSYKESSDSSWSVLSCSNVSGEDYFYEAEIEATWAESKNDAGLTIYTPQSGGVWAGKSYELAMTDGDNSDSSTFSTSVGHTIPNGDMNSSSLKCFGSSSSSSTDWASGNNSYSDELCTYSTTYGTSGCAYLASYTVSILFYSKFAAGNLVFGQFELDGTNGTVSFGQKFEWSSRPTSLNLNYLATVGTESFTANGVSYTKDRARVYIAIVDWSSRAEVTAGTSSTTGIWDPATQDSVSGSGDIIAYGSYYIDNSTSGSTMQSLEIPIHYYDKMTKPDGNYTLVISCAASAYGDYMVGSDDSKLWVDDFTFGYDF